MEAAERIGVFRIAGLTGRLDRDVSLSPGLFPVSDEVAAIWVVEKGR
jgi:hypothetical protein